LSLKIRPFHFIVEKGGPLDAGFRCAVSGPEDEEDAAAVAEHGHVRISELK
jgi:hypothetical protein